jgi:hypothetical protein
MVRAEAMSDRRRFFEKKENMLKNTGHAGNNELSWMPYRTPQCNLPGSRTETKEMHSRLDRRLRDS